MKKDSRIYVAGHTGLVGSALLRRLKADGYQNLILRTHRELNLLRQSDVEDLFTLEKPEIIFVAAARVGGIHANDKYCADFLYENLTISSNLINAAANYGSDKLLFMGSSCIYPKLAPQPVKESSLLTGPVEETNIGYATAKIAAIKLCDLYRKQYKKNFITVVPTNVYGPGDNFHPENSHVVPGLIRKFHQAKLKGDSTVELWGTGTPVREFLYIDDLSDALVMLMDQYDSEGLINIGGGEECSIRDLAEAVRDAVEFKGQMVFDSSKPDGAPKKVLESSKILKMGWKPRVDLKSGLARTYSWAKENGVL